MLGVVDDDADCFGGVHYGAAADGDEVVGACLLEHFDAVLDVFDGGVGLDVVEDLVCETGVVEDVGDFLCDTELHQRLVGDRGGLS